MKKKVYLIAIIAFLGVFAFAAVKLAQISTEYRKGVKEYEHMEQYVQIPETVPAVTEKEVLSVQPQTAEAQA